MILVYRILFLPVLLLALPYYLRRMWKRGGYQHGFANRFGKMEAVPPRRKGVRRIWIQAVSVGELLAVSPLLRQLARRDDTEVILTTTTSTGYQLLRERLTDFVVWYGIFPLDFWPVSARAFRRLQPDLLVLMEGELWPEHLHQARRRGVPVCLINARLSDRSFRRHYRLRRLSRPLMKPLHSILAGSQPDRERFQALNWLPPDAIRFSGNLKLDVPTGGSLSETERADWLRQTGFADPDAAPNTPPPLILLGSSTWPGEETALLEVFESLSPQFPALRLLLVPRHAERRREIRADLRHASVPVVFRSENPVAPPGTRILVADTTGELRHLTELASVVFIGKSLPPHTGGQTPVEAAALGKPLLFGPDMSNFRQIARELETAGAAIRVPAPADLPPQTERLLRDVALRRKRGEAARELIGRSSGATATTLQALLQAP